MDDDLDNQAQAYDPIVEEFATWARHPRSQVPGPLQQQDTISRPQNIPQVRGLPGQPGWGR